MLLLVVHSAGVTAGRRGHIGHQALNEGGQGSVVGDGGGCVGHAPVCEVDGGALLSPVHHTG